MPKKILDGSFDAGQIEQRCILHFFETNVVAFCAETTDN